MMCCRIKEAEIDETHIYNVVDEEHAYEVVMKDGEGKTHQRKIRPVATGKAKQEFDLKPCPAYVPVTMQDTGAKADTHYETVTSM